MSEAFFPLGRLDGSDKLMPVTIYTVNLIRRLTVEALREAADAIARELRVQRCVADDWADK